MLAGPACVPAPPMRQSLQALVLNAPPMTGAEYLSADAHKRHC